MWYIRYLLLIIQKSLAWFQFQSGCKRTQWYTNKSNMHPDLWSRWHKKVFEFHYAAIIISEKRCILSFAQIWIPFTTICFLYNICLVIVGEGFFKSSMFFLCFVLLYYTVFALIETYGLSFEENEKTLSFIMTHCVKFGRNYPLMLNRKMKLLHRLQ